MRSTSEEAEEIRSYSNQNQRLKTEHGTLLEAWNKLRVSETQEAFVDEIKTAVLPALRGYIGHLNEVRTTNEELRSVHYRLIEGYRGLEKKLSIFADEGRTQDKEKAKQTLSSVFQETRDIETVYWQDIQSIYNRHGFQLSQTGQGLE